MHTPTTPTQNLLDILLQILIVATRALRDIHIRAANAHLLKSILAANHAGAHIGRAVRLTTLLIRRIQIYGLTPHAPARPAPATPNARPASTQAAPEARTPRLHTGNADDAFIRRPIPIVIAAITRELHLAARILGVPLPDHLQSLCLHAALATGALPITPPPIPPAQPRRVGRALASHHPQAAAPSPSPHPGPTPPPWRTLEL